METASSRKTGRQAFKVMSLVLSDSSHIVRALAVCNFAYY
jgi:hypothetical protein